MSLSRTSGTVGDGETEGVRVTVDVDDACDDGQESGAVVFTPGGSAPVSWDCD
jgi:hypothetical protein